MAKIACLGWGSLVWDKRDLPITGDWMKDGPTVQVEFLRQSGGNRITLVLHESAKSVQSLWALMTSGDINTAVASLQKREGMPTTKKIGVWKVGITNPPCIGDLSHWSSLHGIDAVIWTNLPPKFAGEDHRVPNVDEVISHLRSLSGKQREDAEEYVRKAPKQTDTLFRKRIEADLGWTSLC